MKVRKGFVSNSSSSSFVISIKRESDTEKECALLFDFFINKLRYDKSFSGSTIRGGFSGTAGQYLDVIKCEQEDIIKDLYWAAKKKEELEELSKNKDAEKMFNHWRNGKGKEIPIRHRREEEKYQREEEKYKHVESYLEREIELVGHQMKDKAKKLIDIKDRLELLSALDPDEEILDINVDNQDPNCSILRSIIQDSSWITIIEESYG